MATHHYLILALLLHSQHGDVGRNNYMNLMRLILTHAKASVLAIIVIINQCKLLLPNYALRHSLLCKSTWNCIFVLRSCSLLYEHIWSSHSIYILFPFATHRHAPNARMSAEQFAIHHADALPHLYLCNHYGKRFCVARSQRLYVPVFQSDFAPFLSSFLCYFFSIESRPAQCNREKKKEVTKQHKWNTRIIVKIEFEKKAVAPV